MERCRIVLAWLPYLEEHLARGVPLARMSRHMTGLYHDEPGARIWRRLLTERASRPSAGVTTIREILERVEDSRQETVQAGAWQQA